MARTTGGGPGPTRVLGTALTGAGALMALSGAANASFLRASLFTSVLSFGVSAMAVGVGVLTTMSGRAVLALNRDSR